MKAEAYLAAIRELPLQTLEGLTGGDPFVVLSPHPDDESLGTGGLIAAACAIGQQVEVVVVTDGSGSHRRSKRVPRDALVALRRDETRKAGEALGLPHQCVTFLDLVDAQAPVDGPAFESAVDHIAELISGLAAKTVFATWKHDPHCDHEAVAAMGLALRARIPALRLWSYPIWGWHLSPDTTIEAPPPRGFSLDVSAWLVAKSAAVAAHASQMTAVIDDDPEGFRFTPDTLAPFQTAYEYFLETS